MNPEATVADHVALCDETYALILEENRILRNTGEAPDEAFLRRKRAILPRLNASATALKDLRENGPRPGAATRRQIETAQRKLMKIFLLDRENEQLLLKTAMPNRGGFNPAQFRQKVAQG